MVMVRMPAIMGVIVDLAVVPVDLGPCRRLVDVFVGEDRTESGVGQIRQQECRSGTAKHNNPISMSS
jgi:hypothetical protein